MLALASLFVLFGLIGGITDSRPLFEANSPRPDEDPWWRRDAEHYREWNAHQVREQHRTGGKGSAPE
jgi:hypothetical protein